jgi:hypothetical protein
MGRRHGKNAGILRFAQNDKQKTVGGGPSLKPWLTDKQRREADSLRE